MKKLNWLLGATVFILMMGLANPAEAVKYYFTTQTVDSTGSVGRYTSIALDSSNKAYISYYDVTNADLKYATNASGSWVKQTVDSVGGVGYFTSIALDSLSKAHISYYETSNDILKYATNATGDFGTGGATIQTVDSTGIVGRYTSLALDSSNKAYISYYDVSNSDLKYATNATGDFGTGGATIQTVDSTLSVGEYTSIALDSSGKAHISYYDATGNGTGDLNYATNASGSWVSQTVDSTGSVGQYTSIALDSSNKAYISYEDATNSSLKYASNYSGSWMYTTVDNAGSVGQYTSIALENSPLRVYISYYDFTNGDLKYATYASGSWVPQTVDSVGVVGYYTSIASDSSGKAHISYQDASNSYLKYATVEAGNTSTDQDGQLISLSDPVASLIGYGITYNDITTEGRTYIAAGTQDPNTALGGDITSVLSDTFRDISIQDVGFSGTFTVRVPYDPLDVPTGHGEINVRLLHYTGGAWQDITSSVNYSENWVEGIASSFSNFGVGLNPEPATLILLGSALFGLLPLRKRFLQK